MVPSLCANGCGFYGSAANKNLCSKCYKDYLKENITKSSRDEGVKGKTKNSITMVPSLCANGCGFNGSAANKNLCSKCYKDYLKENITNSSDDEGVKGETKNSKKDKTFVLESYSSHKPCSSKNNPISDVGIVSLTDSTKMKKNRCKSCNKKVGLTGFKCRCGDVFCGMHRYPEVHACEVDLKEIGRQVLEQQNPLCMGDKLEYRI